MLKVHKNNHPKMQTASRQAAEFKVVCSLDLTLHISILMTKLSMVTVTEWHSSSSRHDLVSTHTHTHTPLEMLQRNNVNDAAAGGKV